mmetsp:Transcript_1987/g.2852  ORF Transcript_1987/g.2852 Transcript_1987/m.2852 type:complete len:130 (-) Transcript_1987:268-657(-)
MNQKAGELHQIVALYSFISTSLNVQELQKEIISSCLLFINQGARRHLSPLYQIIAECSCDLGRLRDSKKYNCLALRFQKTNAQAQKFKEEVEGLTNTHARRGFIFISTVIAFGFALTRLLTSGGGQRRR